MTTYTLTQARRNFSQLLAQARKHGKVIIRGKAGENYTLSAPKEKRSPLDVKGIGLNLTKSEILEIIKESRDRV